MLTVADKNVNLCAVLLAEPRGVSMFACVLGVLDAQLQSVQAVAEWMHRSVREVRRLLIAASRVAVLPLAIRSQIDRVIAPDQGEKSPDTTGEKSPHGEKSPDTTGEKSPLRARERARSLSVQESRIDQNLESHAQEPPLRRPSIVRGIMRRAGLHVDWTAHQMVQLGDRLHGWSDELCAELAQRYVADSSASARARSHLAMFFSLLPVYLMHHRQGAPVGTPSRAEVAASDARLRAELRVGGRDTQPVAEPVPLPQPTTDLGVETQPELLPLQNDTSGWGLLALIQREARTVLAQHYVAQDFSRIVTVHETHANGHGELVVTYGCEVTAILIEKNRSHLYARIAERITGSPFCFVAQFQVAA
jgi:hypothetical protein